MFYFSGYANSDNYVGEQLRFAQLGFPIRKSSDRRLLRTSPRRIVATPRPSSPFDVNASTIRPYDLLRGLANHPNADFTLLTVEIGSMLRRDAKAKTQ